MEWSRTEERSSRTARGAAPITPQSPPQNHRPVLEKVRGSHPSRQASIVDYTVNIPPQITNTKVSGGTVSGENVKLYMKTLDDRSFDENVRSEELSPYVNVNVKINI